MSAPPPRRSARLAKLDTLSKDGRGLTASTQSNARPEPLVEPELPKGIQRVAPVSRGTPKQIGALKPPATPATYALKPPSTEMHPSKFHPTTAEPSSALRLGFTDIDVARRRDSSHGAGLQSTPSKVGGVPSSAFTLRVPHGGDYLGLGPEALRIWEGLKEKAAECKADLLAQRANDASSASADVNGRAIAKPKGKSGRFSAAHMAEFKKMDSIEGHASAWRAQNGRFTPVKSGIKRSLSKANLDTPQKNAKQAPSKPEKEPPSAVPKKPTSDAEGLGRFSPKKLGAKASSAMGEEQSPAKDERPSLPAKRLKKSAEDDASTARPVPRDATSIPRPVSSIKRPVAPRIVRPSLSRLMSPTKSSMGHSAGFGKSEAPTVAPSPKPSFKSQVEDRREVTELEATKELDEPKEPTESNEPEEPTESNGPEELKEPKESGNAGMSQPSTPMKRSVMKSVFGGSLFSAKGKSAIPQPVASIVQTPAPTRFSNLSLSRLAATQPPKKLIKHVTFTPEVTRTFFDPDSPSPLKPSVSKKTPQRPEAKEAPAESTSGDIAYPDLSSYKHLFDAETEGAKSPTPSVPGRFTFRSDHTIKFGNPSPSGFGASPGQSSVRHVRNSIKPVTDMPGGFPDPNSPSSHPNKENAAPSPPKVLPGVPHGMSNKKRHRASLDGEDADKEAADRAGKKAKSSHVPEGQALPAPRLQGSTPSASAKKAKFDRSVCQTPVRSINRTISSASTSKKRPTLSMSRLNMLARPKNRG
ncbi:hypothetical protein Trco_005977 [Trichoderma cornu-damae]|uniref:Uncharacterized protein n=1 Tax=Trichoderma cornu-damae TaxID=654480 RepID=A0A9P8QKI1_9HYPO|nr:hypothetical protein Trco_005977 [Trichoderma cornu-damae]